MYTYAERWCSCDAPDCVAAVQTSELYQWNEQQAGLPLEWPAAAQLGGVIALSQRQGRSDIVIGGFAGCAQVWGGVCCSMPPSMCAVTVLQSDYQTCKLEVIPLGSTPCASMRPQLSRLIWDVLSVMQIVELVPADVDAMSSAQVSRLCASLLPDSWLTAPQEVSPVRTPAMRKAMCQHYDTVAWTAGRVPLIVAVLQSEVSEGCSRRIYRRSLWQ